MDISFAHEQAQRSLRQRNLFALTSVGLLGLSAALFLMLASKDREVILQPVVPQQMAISSAGVSQEYLEAITRDTAQLALNRTPETLPYWMDSLLKITAPEARGALKEDLTKIMDQQSGSQISQFVTIDWIRVNPKELTSEVGAVLHTVVASRAVSKEHKTFRFTWKYEGLSLKLLGFGVVVKKDDKK